METVKQESQYGYKSRFFFMNINIVKIVLTCLCLKMVLSLKCEVYHFIFIFCQNLNNLTLLKLSYNNYFIFYYYFPKRTKWMDLFLPIFSAGTLRLVWYLSQEHAGK